MKKTVYIILFFISATICSCQKEDDNGDLGGFWKLMELTPTGSESIDKKEESLFWRIQLDLIQIASTYGRFQHVGDSLFIQMTDSNNETLKKYGLYNPDNERFAVEHLNRNSMILKSPDAKLEFKKF